jgi:hypothetical protein
MDHEHLGSIVDLGEAVTMTKQFNEGDDDGSPTSPGLNLQYPPVVDEQSRDVEISLT